MSLEINKIHHGDCLDLIKEIPSNSTKLIVADPPYFLGMTHNGQRGSFVDLAICKPFFKELFLQYKRILNDTGEVYFFTDWRGSAFYYPLFDAILGCRNRITWDKMSGPGNFYAFQHEDILFHCVRNDTNKRGGNVWRSKGFAAGAKVTDGEKVHATQKTISIIEKIVTENTEPGDLVLDTFGGSGTTAVVCRKTGRNYIVMELDEGNIDIAITREKSTKRDGLQAGMHELMNFPQIDTKQHAALIKFELQGSLKDFEKLHGPQLEALGIIGSTAQALTASIWNSLNQEQAKRLLPAEVLQEYEQNAPPRLYASTIRSNVVKTLTEGQIKKHKAAGTGIFLDHEKNQADIAEAELKLKNLKSNSKGNEVNNSIKITR